MGRSVRIPDNRAHYVRGMRRSRVSAAMLVGLLAVVACGSEGADPSTLTPTSVDGKAKAGIFGTQSSSCTFAQPGPIATTEVVA
jgi:hypothetical protein